MSKAKTVNVNLDDLEQILKQLVKIDFSTNMYEDLHGFLRGQALEKTSAAEKVHEWPIEANLDEREFWPEKELQKKKPGFRFTDPITAIVYALEAVSEGLNYPIVALFETQGLLRQIIFKGKDSEVKYYDRDSLGYTWKAGTVFLLTKPNT